LDVLRRERERAGKRGFVGEIRNQFFDGRHFHLHPEGEGKRAEIFNRSGFFKRQRGGCPHRRAMTGGFELQLIVRHQQHDGVGTMLAPACARGDQLSVDLPCRRLCEGT